MLLAVVASTPGLFVGFVGDDLIQRLMLDHRAPGHLPRVFGLYDFTPPGLSASVLVESGAFPWFSDPELRLRFFRPLTSLSLALDQYLFGRHAVFAHAHSLLWLAGLTYLSARLYQRWFGRPAAWLAAAGFALAGLHAWSTAWLATRHTLLAATLGVAALWAWVRYREDAWRAGRWLAPLCLIASFLASESAFAGLVFVASYELGTRGLRRGLRATLACLALGSVYAVLYALLGYGSHASGMYLSPFEAPAGYLAAVLVRVPALTCELLLGLPALAAGFGLRRFFLIAGVGAALGYAALLYGLRERLALRSRRALSWLSLATLLSLGALVGTIPTGRVLPLPLLGAAAIVGNALWLLWTRARTAGWSRRLLWALPLVLVACSHFVLSPVLRVTGALKLRTIALAEQELAERAEVGRCAERGYLYLLTGADPSVAIYWDAALRFYTPSRARAKRMRVLSLAPHPQRLFRSAPDALELQVLDLPRHGSPMETLVRAPEHPLVEGQFLQLSEVGVRVLGVEAGRFTRARFEFDHNLDQGDVCLMVWRSGRLEAIPMPAVGEARSIAHEPGPMGI